MEIYNHKIWKTLSKLKNLPYCGYSSVSYFKSLKLGRINLPTHSLKPFVTTNGSNIRVSLNFLFPKEVSHGNHGT